jgi:photosystem II stability/assembly factor-like uncharacterized protein
MKKIIAVTLTILSLKTMGQVWQPYNANLDTSIQIEHISVVDSNTVWGLGLPNTSSPYSTSYRKFTRTINGSTFTSGSFSDSTFNPSNISAINDSTAYIACWSRNGQNGQILKTNNGGITWANIASSNMFTGATNFPDAVHFYDAMNGWALGDPNNTNGWGNEFEIWRTSDGGITWIRVPAANIPNPLSSEYGGTDVYATVSTNHIWFGTSKGRIYYSADKGNTWNVSVVTGMYNERINGVAFRDTINGIAWGQTAGGTRLLCKTNNGGASWTSVTVNTSNVGTEAFCAIPGKGYLSTGLNMTNAAMVTSVTYDDGNTWSVLQSIPNNNSNLSISDIIVSVQMIDSLHGWGGSFSNNTLPNGLYGMNKYIGVNLSAITSIKEPDNFQMYPNPTKDVLNIENLPTNEKGIIQINDMLGNEVKRVLCKTSSVTIGVSDLNDGVYNVNYLSNKENIMNKQIIIVK